MVDTDTDVEQTLHVARSISVYRIPPRPGSNGWRSGEWLVSDKLFSGRLRIVAKGELCELRLEEPPSGELFAVCPIHYGQRSVCVESVTDSSRYYVLRVEDSVTRRHAFLGMGFDNRNDAFDFNEALIRHEQHVARERAACAKVAEAVGGSSSSSCANTAAAITAPITSSANTAASGAEPSTSGSSSSSWPGPQYWGAGTAAASGAAAAEIEGLYRHTAGLRLQEGQTIRVNVAGLRKAGATAGPSAGGGFLSGLSSAQATQLRLPGIVGAPPPVIGFLPPPPQAPASSLSSSSQQGGTVQLQAPPRDQVLNGLRKDGSVMPLTNGGPDSNGFALGMGGKGVGLFITHTTGSIVATSGRESWATFD